MTSPPRETGEVTARFIETTQVFQGNTTPPATQQLGTNIPTNTAQKWDGQPARTASGTTPALAEVTSTPSNPNAPQHPIYRALVIGDNAAGHAISLPVELRDGGVLDFGYSAKQRSFALAA
ncbi:hypothetical protein [Streptomyces werraensis]|uniref:hypothetical protein n=1 Tax=Streptomyces werraensis TaxID=68284 RepID=UPI00342C49BA